jgi:hypothetical protein
MRGLRKKGILARAALNLIPTAAQSAGPAPRPRGLEVGNLSVKAGVRSRRQPANVGVAADHARREASKSALLIVNHNGRAVMPVEAGDALG